MVTGVFLFRAGSGDPAITGLWLTAIIAIGLPPTGRCGKIGRGITL
jgi:hypothetical protein